MGNFYLTTWLLALCYVAMLLTRFGSDPMVGLFIDIAAHAMDPARVTMLLFLFIIPGLPPHTPSPQPRVNIPNSPPRPFPCTSFPGCRCGCRAACDIDSRRLRMRAGPDYESGGERVAGNITGYNCGYGHGAKTKTGESDTNRVPTSPLRLLVSQFMVPRCC